MQVTCKANGKMQSCHASAAEDTNLAHTTVSFPVFQFNAVTKQFVAARKVPNADNHALVNRPFLVVVGGN